MSTLNVDKVDPSTGTALELGTSGDTITVPTGAGLTVVDEVKTNKISPATGVAFALGDSGDTFTVPSGATIVNSGTATGFGITAASFRPNVNPLIINGNMAVAQRGTSFTTSDPAANESEFSADRFPFNTGAIGAYTTINETLTSGDAFEDGFANASRIDCTTAVASPDAGDYFYFEHKMESQNCMVFKKGTTNAEKATLAFWVKSNVTGTGQVNLKDKDNNRMVSGTYTTDVADTWEKKIINFPADTTGAMADDNGVGLVLEFWLGSGTNYSSGTAPTAWEAMTDADRNASGTLNINDSTSNDWAITGVQLEVGEYTSSTIPPFQHESYGDNLARCQRYLFAAVGTSKRYDNFGTGVYESSTKFAAVTRCPVTMRAIPTLVSSSGTNEFYIMSDAEDPINDVTLYNTTSRRSIMIYNNDEASGTAGYGGYLSGNASNAYIHLDAEL